MADAASPWSTSPIASRLGVEEERRMAERTQEHALRTESIASTVPALMPQLKSDLARLVAIPSISAQNYPEETHGPLLEAYDAVVELFSEAGVRVLEPLRPSPKRVRARGRTCPAARGDQSFLNRSLRELAFA